MNPVCSKLRLSSLSKMNLTLGLSKYLIKIFEFLFAPSTRKNEVRIRRRFLLTLLSITVLMFPVIYLYLNIVTAGSRSHVEKHLHALCVIVPFRDRFDEMYEFVPHISKFLEAQDVEYRIFIMNQVDPYRFNRGALINVGFRYSTTNTSFCDYIAMHDVDLLPLNSDLSYAYPGHDVFHVAAPHLHPLYHYSTFLGGIVLINNQQFRTINGLSNKYWGWGREDDEFYVRLKNAKILIKRPENISTNFENTFKHIHGSKRKRDYRRCFDQRVQTSRRDRVTGLNNVDYKIYSARSVDIGNISVTFVNVELNCNRSITPWCNCEET